MINIDDILLGFDEEETASTLDGLGRRVLGQGRMQGAATSGKFSESDSLGQGSARQVESMGLIWPTACFCK